LIIQEKPKRSLELGCGLGVFSQYVAQQGVHATGIDFSSVAIAKAQVRSTGKGGAQPKFLVGDVTHLDILKDTAPFDVSFDVGCFHCLNSEAQKGYVSEVARLLKKRGTHLIWALDTSPSDLHLSPKVIEEVFGPTFELKRAEKSRRRLISSHWYWLVRL
jgi:cyclopropane fatty-acyl-phospholipid synthase-like methyltransferase